ncbi:NAD(P)/FAD-dependent oxidoreductase [Candidatus Halocynthiibacter alkanivorans]|uniref:NAD(P)/FAD-dependent oxidoreductase n=1 Tax=Candidatus Halocynthiibacter alkanivorans TaxID=2267619 RepID=UPI000DF264B0|nr:FAD-dependent oxidoreductase [Candidatus Halocynthiibacter alkanivorans]
MRIVVVGRGLIGSAAARHLALAGHEVLLVGPSEPGEKASHRGVFASHYDQARITRGLDEDPFWSAVSRASIARYRALERVSGVPFYHPVGALLTGAAGGRIEAVGAVQRNAGVAAEKLEAAALAARFPYFQFAPDTLGYFEAQEAGWINPRAMVRAQGVAASHAGARILDAEVLGLEEGGEGVLIRLAGETLAADRVLVAAGGFSPQLVDVDLRVLARTITLFEVSDAQAAELAAQPSLIRFHPDGHETYLLPPVRYSDGKPYLKLGGEPEDVEVSGAAIGDWFRSGGSEAVSAQSETEFRALMPGVAVKSIYRDACVVSYSANTLPVLKQLSERVSVACGGCGKAAKNADELGRIAGQILLGQGDAGYEAALL